MRTIGFKNFRRFENLDPIELSGITFFVGGNNAGKSTVVKAMMLMLDNLSGSTNANHKYNFESPKFLLDANRIHEVHIGTFGRALHKPYPEKREFSISATFANYRIAYLITGDTESSQANGEIAKIEVENIENKVTYVFDFLQKKATILFNSSILKKYGQCKYDFSRMDIPSSKLVSEKKALDNIISLHTKLKKELENTNDLVNVAKINAELEKLENQISDYQNRLDPFNGKLKKTNKIFECNIVDLPLKSGTTFINSLLDGISEYWAVSVLDNDSDSIGTEPEEESTTRESLWLKNKVDETFSNMVKSDAFDIFFSIAFSSIEYISAHAATQKVLFSIEDKNDYMADVINKFMQRRIVTGSEEDVFILNWMKNLNIGLGYEISSIEGEAYTMEIINMNGDVTPLADMGMGSIQMMILLLKLATIINSKKGNNCTIIVEEPEQNIHPKLQSMLVRLFVEVYNKYNFRFVVETHSEYIIRKTQAMIATGEDGLKFKNNPFRVYYFPEKEKPYDMCYRENGLFKEKFDNGFFDEASKQHMIVVKKAIEESNG